MVRQWLKDSVIYGATTIVTRGVAVVMLPFYTRLLTRGEYGAIDILTVVGSILNILLTMEIAQGVARRFTDAETDEEKQAYASTAWWFGVALYSLFVIIGILFANPIASLVLNSAEQAGLFRIACWAIALNGLFYLAQNQLRWQLMPSAFASASLVYTVLAAVVSLALMAGFDMGIRGFFFGQMVAAVVATTLSIAFARAYIGPRFDGAFLKRMLAFSAPLAPASIAALAIGFVDRFLILKLMGVEANGLYSAAFRIGSLVLLAVAGAQSAVTPLIWSRYRDPDAPARIEPILRAYAFGALSLLLGLALFAQPIALLLTGPDFQACYPYALPLAASLTIISLTPFAPGLHLTNKTHLFALINIAGAGLSALLCYFLIGRFGLTGAAMGTLIASTVSVSSLFVISQRFYPIPYRWGTLCAALAVATVFGLVGRYFETLILDGWVLLAIRTLVLLFSVLVLARLLVGEIRAGVTRIIAGRAG